MSWLMQYPGILATLTFLILGYGFGRYSEKRHYQSIFEREKEYQKVLIFSVRTPPQGLEITDTNLVCGNVVVSIDYFKKFVAGLRKLIGGRLRSYETLVDRARREAILRMKGQAIYLNANSIINVKLETSSISKGPRGAIGSIEVCAYGTALHHD